MSKPKKPAEDNSKAGAVTNSIADEVDEIFKPIYDDYDGNQPMMPSTIGDVIEQLLTLIADRERKARIDELEDLEIVNWEGCYDEPLNYDTGINELIDPLVANYVKERLAELQTEDKES